jgi:predicted ATPase
MIHKVTVQNFKRFKDSTEFTLSPKGVSYLAGGNNSGKSTLLQALAIWEFARNVISLEQGEHALLMWAPNNGVGMSAEDFSPVSLPDLKHLWNDLKVFSGKKEDGYTLKIRCDWNIGEPTKAKHLEIGLSLSNDRVFMKKTTSSLVKGDSVPRVAYLPPFAGITAREDKMSAPQQKRWIGRGLAGAVLRNLILQLHEKNEAERLRIKGDKKKIQSKALAELRASDPWERLAQTLEEVFKTGLTVERFNELYHTAIQVRVWEGRVHNKQFLKLAGTSEKDLMVEGSGFLQWLSVYALAVNKEVDVLLLDEPDAHLHPALQGHLTHKLSQLAIQNAKQVLLATHSTTILSHANVSSIFHMERKNYLTDDSGRILLFEGIGSAYCPLLDQLKRHKKVLFYEGSSDFELLTIWAKTLRIPWPQNVVLRESTRVDRGERALIFREFRKEIPTLKGLSLQDRDDYPLSQVKQDLTFDGLRDFDAGLGLRKWRRRNIESYLLCTRAIAQASGKSEAEVKDVLTLNGVALPPGAAATNWNCPEALALCDGKKVILHPGNPNSIVAKLGCTYIQIAEAMQPQEIPDDVKEFLKQLDQFAKP